MIQWLTKSRLRIALVMMFFGVVFLCSIFLVLTFLPQGANKTVVAGQDGTIAPVPNTPPNLVALTGMVTAVGSVLGTISTVLLAWRADRRTAKESDLKLVQLQQQIKELELKLKAQPDDPH